ncbi:hypothetical protein D3C78_1008110 [compost metagenome]
MSQQQAQMPKPYVRTKRDEMTFGYLPEFVPNDLVGNLKGDARLYTSNEVYDLMMRMDEGFVGMRRSVIDRTEAVRQLILYMPATKLVDDVLYFAVYQRAAGAEAKLKDGFSIGFGGHVEQIDLVSHYTTDEQGRPVQVDEVPSSFYSTMNSGMRELSEEVAFFTPEGVERDLTVEEMMNYIGSRFGMRQIGYEFVAEVGEEFITRSLVNIPDHAVIMNGEPGQGTIILKEGVGSVAHLFREVFQAEPRTSLKRADLSSNLVPCGFISDRDVEGKPGHVGNTHIAVVALLRVDSDIDFRVMEEKYSTIGWKTKEELKEMHARCEPWTQYLIEHLDGLEEIARTQCFTTPPEQAQVAVDEEQLAELANKGAVVPQEELVGDETDSALQ